MEEIGEQKADELEGHGNESIPDEGEHRSDKEAIHEDVIAVVSTRSENGSLPIWWCCVCGGLFVGLSSLVMFVGLYG